MYTLRWSTRTSFTSPEDFVAHLKRFKAFSGASSSPTTICRCTAQGTQDIDARRQG